MKSRITINKSRIAELLSELLGTMILLIAIFSLILILRSTDPLLLGLFYIALLYAFGGYSKTHFNPVYSFADFLYSIYKAIRMRNKDVVIKGAIKFVSYFLAQLAGAVLAYVIVTSLAGSVGDFYMAKYGGAENIKTQILTETTYGATLAEGAETLAFFLEMMFTAMLVWFSTVSSKKHEKTSSFRPVILGLALCAFMFLVKDVSGSIFNMLQNIVAAMFTGEPFTKTLWVYTLAPLAGAAIAVVIKIIFSLLCDNETTVAKEEGTVEVENSKKVEFPKSGKRK